MSAVKDDQHAVLNWLDSQAGAMRDLTETVCNINSYTENAPGIDKVRAIFKTHFDELADEVNEVEMPDHEIVDANGNLLHLPVARALQAIRRPNSDRKVFLCIHLDTVYSEDSSFQSCNEIKPGILNGPGVVDAKGGAVVMLYALKAFERFAENQSLGWEVVLNSDEEVGSPSSQDFVKSRAKLSDFGLLYEPALPDGTLVDERKGSGNFSIIVRGRSVHSGRDFENGRNAITRAADMAVELHELNNHHPETTVNVARIDGGGPLNVVPDLAVIRVNVRVADESQQAWIEQRLEEIVSKCGQMDGFSCELHGDFFSPPKILCDSSKKLKQQIESSANKLGIEVGWRSTGGVSDGNKLASVNVPNIDTLGVRGDNLHSHDEYLVLDSLVERAKLTTLILLQYATGEFSLNS